jgi:hypothetical protein
MAWESELSCDDTRVAANTYHMLASISVARFGGAGQAFNDFLA